MFEPNWDGAIRKKRKTENVCTVKTQLCCSFFKSAKILFKHYVPSIILLMSVTRTVLFILREAVKKKTAYFETSV